MTNTLNIALTLKGDFSPPNIKKVTGGHRVLNNPPVGWTISHTDNTLTVSSPTLMDDVSNTAKLKSVLKALKQFAPKIAKMSVNSTSKITKARILLIINRNL